MSDASSPVQDDIAAMKGILEMLESKKARLTAQRSELEESICSLRQAINSESDRQRQLEQSYAQMSQQITDIPSQADSLSGQKLVARIAELKEQIASSQTRIAKQNEVKKSIMDQIYAPPMERARRTSLRFIHHALLNELADLVREDASPAALQQKDKQIQLCEAVQQL
jgi:chromosome segregation ATPase